MLIDMNTIISLFVKFIERLLFMDKDSLNNYKKQNKIQNFKHPFTSLIFEKHSRP